MKLKTKHLTIGLSASILFFAIAVRFFGLMHTPPSLYWEEAALGYDAYSILQTGKDHHGNAWPIVAFESFGDWKPSLYFYTLVPFIALFDLQPWVVRLPSVLAGISMVIAVGLLSKKTSQLLDLKQSNLFGLIGLFIASISTWAIHFSRSGWEVNLATSLLTWGVVLGIHAVDHKQKILKPPFVVTSTILLIASVYAYHGTRLVSPLIGISLAIFWTSNILEKKKFELKKFWSVLASGTIAVLLMLPLLLSLRSPEVSQRFAETSIFSNLDIIIESNEAKEAANNSFVSKIVYHRYVLFGREVVINYLDHFNFDFLFISGDINPRHSTGYSGHLYYQELLFLVLGTGLLLRKKEKISWLVLSWWIIAIIPASLTKTTPHALRILPAMPVMLVLISLGVGVSIQFLVDTMQRYTTAPKALSLPIVSAALASVYFVTFGIWWRQYWLIYPQQQSHEWQFGYEQMIHEVEMLSGLQNTPVYITREQGRPAMYYWFFTKTDPSLVQLESDTAKMDQGEFLSFQNISFPNTVAEVSLNQEGAIIASSQSGLEYFQEQNIAVNDLVIIKDTFGKVVWNVYTVRP